ncbi:MAG: pseudouridine synthase [[Pasteurella] mairii]|uniref:Pseudouridine synthase n=1 Tax=[Pasteurella] mairii TaxID=757 RepID=A0A379B436_9PAST|nr:pseudouridine synthase [[Pasteurella] mairii]SUB33271.1 Uncharacterised protein [[Pasteurella] mairii]
MKKYLSLIMALLAMNAIANTVMPVTPSAPIIYLSTVDTSGNILKSLNTTIYSVSNAKLNLCWEVAGMPLSAQNNVVEVMTGPERFTVIGDNNSSVDADKSGKVYTIKQVAAPAINNEFIRRCWKFDKNDPLGEYKLDVDVNGVSFPTRTFTLIK